MGDEKKYMDTKRNTAQSHLMKALSFNILIGNNDMHGGNIKVLLNKNSNPITNKPDFEFAPFYDITPHSINQSGNNELLRHGKNLNTLEANDLVNTQYRGIARTDIFQKEFSEAKKMVKIYKEKVSKLLEKTPELLSMFRNHFTKVNEFNRVQNFNGVDYDLSVLDKDNRKRPDQVKRFQDQYKHTG
jgi:serine/threonine protein kinase HipA of HipAB toxin-antitoxin module